MSFYYECIYTFDIMHSPPKDLELKYPWKTDMIYILVLLAILSPLMLEIQTCDISLCIKDTDS